MRILSTFSLIALFLFSAHCAFQKQQEQAQPKPATTLEPTTFSGDYPNEWRAIDSLERQGLYKSALERTEALQARAKKDGNTPQVLKTLLFRGKYTTMLEEDGFVKAVQQFEAEAASAPALEKAVLESMLGQMYATYLQNQGWRLNERTPIPDGEGGDILTWSAEQIERRALNLYQSSLKPAELLRQTPAEYLRDITQAGQGDTATAPLRPTLYEFLAFRALEHFGNERSYLTEPAYKFYIDQPAAFAPAAQFVNTSFPSKDTTSGKWLAINLFRELTSAHLNDKDPSALIDIELQRLEFVYNNSVLTEKDSLYEQALLTGIKTYDHLSAAEFMYRLANLYFLQSNEKPAQLQRAVSLCEDAIQKYPNSYGARQCSALIAQIRRSELQVTTEQAYLPDRPMLALIGYKNVGKVWMKAVPFPQDPEEWARIPWNERVAYYNRQKPAWSQTLDLPNSGDYAPHRAECKMPALPAGKWVVLVSEHPDFDPKKGYMASAEFSVSRLAAMMHQEEGKTNIWSVDRASGAPRAAVKADIFTNRWNRKEGRNDWQYLYSKESDRDGRIRFEDMDESQGVSVRLSQAGDTLWLNGQFINFAQYEGAPHRVAQFFTDRSLYRPGQTVYFKAVLLNMDAKGMPSIAPNTAVTLQFFDANGQPKNKLELRSNAFGTVNGAFQAPTGGLTGGMSIVADGWDGSANFNVEEYKRPRFEVVFKPVEGAFRLDETVAMRGSAKNYAGNAVDGAQVRFRVVRTARFPFWDFWAWRKPFPWRMEEMEIANGFTTTDADGNFTIAFPALPDRSIPAKEQPLFDFTVYADVTDISGETRSGMQSLSIGYAALQVQLPDMNKIHLDSLNKFEIKTSNLAGQFQAASGNITLQRLVQPKELYNKRYWETPDQTLLTESEFKRDFPDYAWKEADNPKNWDREDFTHKVAFNTAQNKVVNLQTGAIRPGYYYLTLETADAYGVPVKLEKVIAVWNDRERQWLFETPGLMLEKDRYEPGTTARVWMGSPVAGLQFLVGTERDGRFDNLRWQKADAPAAYDIAIQESDRGGFSVHAQAVWNNRLYEIPAQYVTVPWSNKELQIQFETFRDKLAPGQKEEWRLKISGPAKEKVAAEMVAAMYDASLDQFLPHDWYGVGFPMHYTQISWRNVGLFGEQAGLVYHEIPEATEPGASRAYRQLNWFGFPLYGGRYYGMAMRNRAEKMEIDGIAVMAAPAAAPMAEMANGALDIKFDKSDTTAPPGALAGAPPAAPPSPIRTNLNETVFFFPALTTDADGNVILKFTMNEALTRWKLLTFTHTKSLQNALATREVVTQKDLMVITNPPRFLRAGDEIEFAAKVSNLTDKALSGTATLALLDAASLQPVEQAFGLTLQSKKVNFTAPAGQSAPLAWKVRIPADFTGAVTWQVFAECPTARDGEESTIPVVTNRMLVTETMPVTVRGGQSKTFVFDEAGKKESATRKNHRYTLEFTSNPAWYAVQSLPYLMEFPHECNEQIFNRLYANTLAQHVTQKQPAIRRVYERWKATGALKSNLSKNQELKSALLEETPWVLDAQSEEQQQQNIALLFDLNRMADERERALNSLAAHQSNDGGWPWFPGGRDSWYVTQYILSGFGHLQHLGALDQQNDARTGEMVEKALRFCQEETEKHYREIEKEVKAGRTKWEDDHLDGIIIQYLYARSFFTVDRTDKITAYYLDQAEKYWLGKGLYQEGMLSLALHRHGRPDAATKIVNSLRERALVKEELGMYWVFDWGYYWYQLPVETQALMVEVFDEVAQDKTAVENLRIWLLKNKQTNRWESTKATSEAVYALLLRGDNWLNNSKTVQVTMGSKSLQPKEVEAGTGYFKQSWTGSEVKPDWNKLKVDNPNSNIVWGAAYWQYFEDLDKITSFKKTPLTVVKTLYREENSPTGPKLVALQSGDGLKVGDKVKVRIELRVDRAMEFVHLKDMRAAGFEPVNVLSGYRWQDGLGYYESTKDLATHFFIDYLPRGTFVMEYMLVVSHKGDMSNGVTTLQCMYAPEFSSHSEGVRVRVE